MYMNKFITGAVIGGTLSAAGVAYALTSNREKKMLMKRGKKMFNKVTDRMYDLR